MYNRTVDLEGPLGLLWCSGGLAGSKAEHNAAMANTLVK